jgi:hypothetical protein
MSQSLTGGVIFGFAIPETLAKLFDSVIFLSLLSKQSSLFVVWCHNNNVQAIEDRCERSEATAKPQRPACPEIIGYQVWVTPLLPRWRNATEDEHL